jgi:hypothetical protein
LFTPVFYVVVRRLFPGSVRRPEPRPPHRRDWNRNHREQG